MNSEQDRPGQCNEEGMRVFILSGVCENWSKVYITGHPGPQAVSEVEDRSDGLIQDRYISVSSASKGKGNIVITVVNVYWCINEYNQELIQGALAVGPSLSKTVIEYDRGHQIPEEGGGLDQKWAGACKWLVLVENVVNSKIGLMLACSRGHQWVLHMEIKDPSISSTWRAVLWQHWGHAGW